MIYYGVGHFYVDFRQREEEKAIKMIFIDGPLENQEKIFEKENEVTIGRQNTNTIPINEYGISRV